MKNRKNIKENVHIHRNSYMQSVRIFCSDSTRECTKMGILYKTVKTSKKMFTFTGTTISKCSMQNAAITAGL